MPKLNRPRVNGKGATNTLGGRNHENLLISRFNRGITNAAGIENQFNDIHSRSGDEHAVVYDARGNVVNYVHGDRGSVASRQGLDLDKVGEYHVAHNHPVGGWGNFSNADLENWARDNRARSVSAHSSSDNRGREGITSDFIKNWLKNERNSGTYHVVKTSHFKAREFTKALSKEFGDIRNAKNYDKAMSDFLRKNAIKFGYEYRYKPDAITASRGVKSITAGSKAQRTAHYKKLFGDKAIKKV